MDPFLWLILTLLDYYLYAVVIAVILSLLFQFNVINSRNQFVALVSQFFYAITEPVFARIRRYLPSVGGFDLSPMVIILGIAFLQRLLIEFWPR